MDAVERPALRRSQERLLDGYVNRIDDLYARHAPDALRLAYLLTSDKDAAQDLVQEAFVRIALRFRHIRNPDSLDAYLRRTVVNLANSYFRRRKRERAYLEARAAQATADVEKFPDLARQLDLRRTLLRLPPRQRAAIVLRYYADLSEQQTADALNCSVGALKSLVLRGMTTLRNQLERHAQ